MSISDPLIRPLTWMTPDGTLYERTEPVIIEIKRMLYVPHSGWMAESPELRHETLVYLVREIHGQNQKIFGHIAHEISRRMARLSSPWVQGFDPVATEHILWQVENEIFDLLLADPPSRQSEFLEVAFGQAVVRRTINAVEKYEASTMGQRDDVVAHSMDDDNDAEEFERTLGYAADREPSPEAALLQKEDLTIRRKWYWKARRAVKNPRHLKAATLHWCEGYAIESDDPDVPSLVRYFNVTPRQARHMIETAIRDMRDGLDGLGGVEK